MKIERMFENYLKNSEIYKKRATFLYEKSAIKSLNKCLLYLRIDDSKKLKPNVIDKIVTYYQTETSCKSISINHNIGVLKRVVKFNNINNEYLLKLKKLKVVKKHFPIFNDEQLNDIFKYVNGLNRSTNSSMYKLIVYMLLDTGCRINELINIKKSNIDLDNQNIYLEITKNGKPRYVLFTKLSKKLINETLKRKNPTEYLFFNEIRNRKINYNDVKLFFNRMRISLDIGKLHAHMFRRTFATKLHENGASLISIQLLLGHETLEMTRNYIEVSLTKIKRDYDDYHHVIML